MNIKSYTDLGQSKKLAEILPLESADMFYDAGNETQPTFKLHSYGHIMSNNDVCTWSLAGLLGVLPEYNLQRTNWGNKTEYKIVVTVNEDNYASKNYDNPVDACYNLILKLNELKLL